MMMTITRFNDLPGEPVVIYNVIGLNKDGYWETLSLGWQEKPMKMDFTLEEAKEAKYVYASSLGQNIPCYWTDFKIIKRTTTTEVINGKV